MPGFNQTGPSGRGPMTGRGRGLCNAGIPSGADFGRGMGFGRGFRGGSGPEMGGFMGRGLARNRAVFQDAYPQDAHVEINRLKMQAESMRRTLDTLNQRLSEMEKSA
jgi:hypothetical protein